MRNKRKLDEIVERSLRQAALWDEVKNRLKASGLSLSGGQAQRLCIARTLAVEPDVVLMDEPCSALDPIATGAIEDLMREIKSRYTIVIVTHNMQQATRVSDRTAFYSVLRQREERHPHGRARRVRPDPADLRGPGRPPHPGLRHRPDGLSRRGGQPIRDRVAYRPSVATRMALMVWRRFSAWSNTMLAPDSKTSPVTSSPEVMPVCSMISRPDRGVGVVERGQAVHELDLRVAGAAHAARR